MGKRKHVYYGDSSGLVIVITVLVIAVICGLIGGAITNSRGRGFGVGVLYGVVLSFIGVNIIGTLLLR
jgi:uncharacterized membrane protein YeaQ/YmgE (transglycosylase-associated protein family)